MASEGNAERREVEDYLKTHDLQNILNEIVNATIKNKAEVPLEFLVNLLREKDKRGILSVSAREALDATGRPTLVVDVTTPLGVTSASVPAGPATSPYGAVCLKDTDKARYCGGGATLAVQVVNEQLGPAIIGMDPTQQRKIDLKLAEVDGTQDKSKVGANALLATSLAVARAGAKQAKVSLYRHIANLGGYEDVIMPVPSFCVMEGGSNSPKTSLPLKEFLIMPTSCGTYSEALRVGREVFEEVKVALVERAEEDEILESGAGGAWAPEIEDYQEALTLLAAAVEKAGYTDQVKFALNIDGSRLLVPKMVEDEEGEEGAMKEVDPDDDDERAYNLAYKVEGDDGSKAQPSEDFATGLGDLIEKYPIVSLEDVFSKHDLPAMAEFTATRGDDVQIVGDALVGSNAKRVEQFEASNAVNAITLRPMEVGTLTEVLELVQQAQKLNWGIVFATQGPGETEDDWLADLAVGTRAGQMKAGPPVGSERVAKYNRLLWIEDELGDGAAFVGNQFRRPPAS